VQHHKHIIQSGSAPAPTHTTHTNRGCKQESIAPRREEEILTTLGWRSRRPQSVRRRLGARLGCWGLLMRGPRVRGRAQCGSRRPGAVQVAAVGGSDWRCVLRRGPEHTGRPHAVPPPLTLGQPPAAASAAAAQDCVGAAARKRQSRYDRRRHRPFPSAPLLDSLSKLKDTQAVSAYF
jgi:hypothetical protein